jgi:hypothetical protein
LPQFFGEKKLRFTHKFHITSISTDPLLGRAVRLIFSIDKPGKDGEHCVCRICSYHIAPPMADMKQFHSSALRSQGDSFTFPNLGGGDDSRGYRRGILTPRTCKPRRRRTTALQMAEGGRGIYAGTPHQRGIGAWCSSHFGRIYCSKQLVSLVWPMLAG